MKLRTISRLSVVTLVVVVGITVLFLRGHSALGSAQAAQPPSHFARSGSVTTHLVAGTALNGSAAPDFQLRDQHGAVVSLNALRGHPVVLTFIDATCTTECPITAQYLDMTAQLLGPKANQVVWLAMTVNPTNTVADAREFMTKNTVRIPLHLLLGTQAQLAPLWSAYHIFVQPSPTGDVNHTIVTYLIDGQGHEVEVLDQVY
ncbi:MAG: SCO family protein, partial [Ktedonobacterales bacterium]